MKTLRSSLQNRYGDVSDNWLAWLCLNPDNERTAIWLDQKFDVPETGQWLSESVIALFVSLVKVEHGYPGLLIFECKSLDAEDDELEKYAFTLPLPLLTDSISSENIAFSTT